MSKKIQAIRGMNDVLPIDSVYWQYFENIIQSLANRYGYQEIRTPIVEKTELFCRGVGEVTDIVEKEMYTFDDRNGDSLSLRPEGTAGCVRAAIEHGLLHNQTPKLWYKGLLFRHERPQKGRYRQFNQIGFEAFGEPSPELDVEMILLNHRLWHELGIAAQVRLEINSLGTSAEREAYRQKLIAYYEQHQAELDEDAKRRLYTNPLRILDSKNPVMREINQQAPKLLDELTDASKQHFTRVCQLLDQLNINYVVNPSLVRGLDYYGHTVFEWVTDALGAQGTISAGGRYDGLVELLGGKPTPAVGFAMGVERIIELLRELNQLPEQSASADIYFVALGAAATTQAMLLAEQLRSQNPTLKIIINYSNSSLKSQLKKADQSAADYAVIIADNEIAEGQATVKALREDKQQQQVAFAELVSFFKTQFA